MPPVRVTSALYLCVKSTVFTHQCSSNCSSFQAVQKRYPILISDDFSRVKNATKCPSWISGTVGGQFVIVVLGRHSCPILKGQLVPGFFLYFVIFKYRADMLSQKVGNKLSIKGRLVTFKVISLLNGYNALLQLLSVFLKCTFIVPLKTRGYEP